jgi:hypothetical protein
MASPQHQCLDSISPINPAANVLEPARVDSPSFGKVYPEAARQWLYEKNVDLKPEMVTKNSGHRVFWIL